MKTLDIIVPVFNEESVLPLFFDKLFKVLKILENQCFIKLLFIDNCSSDKTKEIIESKCVSDKRFNYIRLSRNFGYQASIECGLRNSEGDLTAIIDADGEDPPELLIRFFEEHEKGFEIVYGERIDRYEHIIMKKLRKLYYRFVKLFADENFILDMAEFSLFSAEVRKSILAENNSFPFFRSAIGRVGFSIQNVPYKRCKRLAGVSHYNFWRMSVFGLGGFLTSSTFLLRLPAFFSPLYCTLFLMLLFWNVKNCENLKMLFYFFIITSIFFISFMGSILCLYIARIYKNSLNRKNYIIDTRKSFLNK